GPRGGDPKARRGRSAGRPHRRRRARDLPGTGERERPGPALALARRGSPVTVHEWGTAPDFVGPRHELRERLLVDLLLSGRPGPTVLNAAAGPGALCTRLEGLGFDVTSIDASPSAVAVLRDRVAGQVVGADVTALPFRERQFDAAVLGEGPEHSA